MSTIGAIPSGGYYQLSNLAAGSGGNSRPNAADALLQAMSAMDSSSPSSSDNAAFLLDLSPTAQQYLNGLGSSGSDPLGGNGSFILSSAQQKTLSDILVKYKDAPYTQDTFNQIQNDLNAAGLGPEFLAIQDQVKSFDPALVLLDALNGDTDGDGHDGQFPGMVSTADEHGKSQNFMQQVMRQWQTISTTYAADGAAGA